MRSSGENTQRPEPNDDYDTRLADHIMDLLVEQAWFLRQEVNRKELEQ